MLPTWVGKYVGIPFKELGRDCSGCDCYGLVLMVLKKEFGVEPPDYTGRYDTTRNGQAIDNIIERESAKWDLVDTPRVGDAVLFRVAGLKWHIGVMVGLDVVLHTERGKNTIVERIDSLRWRNRIEGYYRYDG